MNSSIIRNSILGYWIKISGQWVKWKIPRGEEWLDKIVDFLGMEKRNGDWIEIFHLQPGLKEKLISAIQLLYMTRREQSPNLEQKKYWNRKLNHIEYIHQITEISSYPLTLMLEVTDDCNLRCPMCPQVYEKVNRLDLSMEIWNKIKNIIPYLDRLDLVGFGEPLMSKCFFHILELFPRDYNLEIQTTTNGLLLSPDVAEKLVKSPLTKIFISLESLNKNTYRNIRGYDGYQKVISNLITLKESKIRNHSVHPEIWINYVMQRSNLEQLPEFVKRAVDYGVTGIQVLWFVAYTRDQWKNSLLFNREKTNQILDKTVKIAEENSMKLNLPSGFDLTLPLSGMDKSPYNGSCSIPWDTVYINSDLTVRPCSINRTDTGDLRKSEFNVIWNSKSYKEFRGIINSDSKQYRCQYCYFRNPRMNNIYCHLVDLKKHYDELDISERLALPKNYSDNLNEFVNNIEAINKELRNYD